MSISIWRRRAAGAASRKVDYNSAAPDPDFSAPSQQIKQRAYLYGIDVDIKTTTLKIHEQEYKQITTFQSFR